MVNNDDESDEDEDAKTISAEPRGVEVAESKEAEAETESRAGAETEVGESSDAQRFNNEKNEDAEDVEINPELLDEYVKAACNVGLTLTQETIEKFPQYFDGGETKHAEFNKIDSENKDSDSQGMDTVTQETILKFPQFFNSDLNKTDSLSQGSDSDNMRRLVTPLINYIDQDRMPPVSRNIACWRFIERLRNFKYLDWKNIDPTKLEYQ
ncbi:hypothetical protein P8452_33321 [Trifolium repens]|nr:hypothetical protein P8452_33321 [Trifolium repens]